MSEQKHITYLDPETGVEFLIAAPDVTDEESAANYMKELKKLNWSIKPEEEVK